MNEPRPFDPMPTSKNGGFTAQSLTEWQLKHVTEDAWKHCYHKPYSNDWGQATELAHKKMKEENLLPDGNKKRKVTVMPTFTDTRRQKEKELNRKIEQAKKEEKERAKAMIKKTKENCSTKQYVTFDKKPKTYVVVTGTKDKDLAIEVANKNVFKIGKEKAKTELEVVTCWLLGDDLYLDRPNLSAKKEIAVTRKKK